MSRKELSEGTGISYATIVNSISRSVDPNLDNAFAIADFLGLPIEYLYKGSDFGMTKDVFQVAKSLETLTEEQRAPLIYMINQQIEYWKKVNINGNAHN